MTSGSGIFFDGNSSTRQEVVVELTPLALIIRKAGGQTLAQWPYSEIEQVVSPDKVLRLAHGRASLARLEVRDPAFAATIDEAAARVDRTGAVQRRMSMKMAALVVVAVISIATMALVALPALATRLTPLLPYGIERKLGEAVDAQLRATLGSGSANLPLDCGEGDREKAGRAALAALIGKLEPASALPMPLRIGVLRRKEANAVALPGGQIYVFKGLIDKAETPDELAGVIAHEIGHVARRDGVKSVLETAGLSFLFGILFGDFVGGGAIVVAARTVLQSSYSREAEASSDAFAVALMNRAGGNAEALGSLLTRIDDLHGAGPAILRDHPVTANRVAAIRSLAKPASAGPLLDRAQWAALKNICAGS
jgi:Zn-dependent protease with chaperone function